MANKKKIEERIQILQARKTEQRTRMIGLGVIIVVLLLLGYMFLNNGRLDEPDLPVSTLPPVTEEPVEAVATQEPEVSESPFQYDSYPPMAIDVEKKYLATVRMVKGGEFVIELYPDKAPRTVNSFVFLAREGYFDGVTFHRVLEGFMAQGGDPTGTGTGGPGYQFDNEDSDLTFDQAGVVAMANAGRDTNGSQFFITFVPTPQLNGGYTIFGQVIEGMDVVNGIRRRDPLANPSFAGDAIETIIIIEE